MKKTIFLTIVTIVLGMFFLPEAFAQQIIIEAAEIEIATENIRLRKLDFHTKEYIEVSTSKQEHVKLEHTANKLLISAEEMVNINLLLPDTKSYYFTLDGEVTCRFDKKMVQITGKKGEQITIDKNSLIVLDDDGGNQVEINREGIFILSEDDRVEISSQGIIVESEDDSKNLTGFWGRLLGKSIRSVVNLSFKMTAGDITKIARQFHNEKVSQFEGDFGAAGTEKQNFEGTFSGKPDLTLHVENKNGFIKLIPWQEDFVKVTAEIIYTEASGKDDIDIAIWGSKSGDVCHVQTKETAASSNATVHYTIYFPETGKIGSLTTVNGNISLNDFTGEMNLTTTNGSINGSRLNGVVNAKTVNGNINLKQIQTISRAVSTNGNIYLTVRQVNTDAKIATSTGNVSMSFLENINAQITATTSIGKINRQIMDLTIREESRYYLHAFSGKGGKKINVSTSTGNITLNQK